MIESRFFHPSAEQTFAGGWICFCAVHVDEVAVVFGHSPKDAIVELVFVADIVMESCMAASCSTSACRLDMA